MQYGTIHCVDRYTYIGNIQHNDMEQQGKIVFANSDEYVGMFRNNHMSGYGVYKFSDGNIYSGFFINDKPHGLGSYQTPSWIMKGNWVNGQRDGWFTKTTITTSVTQIQRYAQDVLQHEKKIQYVAPDNLVTMATKKYIAQKFQPKQCLSCEQAADCVIEACGHVVCCWLCLDKLTTCPMCRIPITKKIKLYI